MREDASKEMRLLLEMFYDISALLTLGPSLENVLQEMFKKIKEQTGISSILIWLLDQKKEFFDLAASCHLPKAMIDIFKANKLKSHQGTPGLVLKTRKFYLMEDVLTNPRAVPQYVETVLKTKAPIRSIASFPMIAGGEGIGVFSFFFSGPKKSISRIEFIIFSTIANQIASFVKNTGMLKEVKEEKNKTSAIITNFSDGILVFDEKNRLVLINPRAEKLLKTAAVKITGKSLLKLKEVASFKALMKILGDELKSVFREELALDDELILEVSTISIMNGKEKFGTLAVLHDISREKALEKIKSEFVFLAAHQLRTPLAGTKWAMKMMIEGNFGEINQKQKELLESGYESNERMVALVNDLLNVASIEEGKFGYSFVLADFGEVINEAIKEQNLLARKKNVKINFKKPAESLKIEIDRQKIKMAVGNLLENAINYSRTGDSVKIILSRRGPSSVEVAIKDNGIGIPKEHLSRLFSKFFRAKNAIQIQPEGSGLGLFIAKNIIEKHGGKIRINSEEGKGTTARFTLLLKRNLKEE